MVKAHGIKKILFIRADALGDALLASSLLPALKNYYLHAYVTVLCPSSLESLYKHSPFVDEVMSFDKKNFMLDKAYHNQLLNTLQLKKIDLAFNTVYSRELALDILATGINARHSVAFKVPQRRGRWDFPFRYNKGYTLLVESSGLWKLEIERYRDFLQALHIPYPEQLSPQVWPSADDELFAENFFKEHNLESHTTLAFFAGALSVHRLYDRYGQALEKAFAGKNMTVIALGAATDNNINEKNLSGLTLRTINLCGKTTVLQAAAIIKRCRLAFGAETGLAHMACAVGIPHVILLGGGHFGRFMPYSSLTSSVILPLDCYGCDWRCKYTTTHCVQDVNFNGLAYALQETLKSTTEKPRIFVQPKSSYDTGFFKPAWKVQRNLFDESKVNVIEMR